MARVVLVVRRGRERAAQAPGAPPWWRSNGESNEDTVQSRVGGVDSSLEKERPRREGASVRGSGGRVVPNEIIYDICGPFVELYNLRFRIFV